MKLACYEACVQSHPDGQASLKALVDCAKHSCFICSPFDVAVSADAGA